MPKSQFINPSDVRKSSSIKFEDIPVNQYNKTINDEKANFSNEDLALLNQAVDRAESKGAKESLVLMDQLALIVSIKNRTVITAVDGESMKENVFTNIDSAVIAK
jgi:flagellar operon protein